jgi:hypothetical protein
MAKIILYFIQFNIKINILLKNEHKIIGILTCQKSGSFYNLSQIHTIKQ